MKFTADASKFEFTENVEDRTITLITHEAHTVFYFPKDFNKEKFLGTYDFFLDFSVSKLPRAMSEIASSIHGAQIRIGARNAIRRDRFLPLCKLVANAALLVV